MKSEVIKYFYKIKTWALKLNSGQVTALVLVSLAVILGGVLALNNPSNSQDVEVVAVGEPVNFNIDQKELTSDALQNIKTVSEIQALSLESKKEISGLELMFNEGVLIYVAHHSDGSTQSYNAYTAELTDFTTNKSDFIQSEDILPPDFSPSISFAGALNQAKEQYPDRIITKLSLGIETSIAMYGIFFEDQEEVYLAAYSGNFVTIPDPEPITYVAADTSTNSQPAPSSNNNQPSNFGEYQKQYKELIKEYRKKIKNSSNQEYRDRLEDYLDRIRSYRD